MADCWLTGVAPTAIEGSHSRDARRPPTGSQWRTPTRASRGSGARGSAAPDTGDRIGAKGGAKGGVQGGEQRLGRVVF